MKIMNTLPPLLILLSLTLLACTTQHETTFLRVKPGPDPAESKLAEAATHVTQSLAQLEQMQKASTPPEKQVVDIERYHVLGTASLDWTGPIEPLMTTIAKQLDYKLRVLGKQPAVPIIISITADNTPLADIIKDTDFQAGTKANVYVYPHLKILELQYQGP